MADRIDAEQREFYSVGRLVFDTLWLSSSRWAKSMRLSKTAGQQNKNLRQPKRRSDHEVGDLIADLVMDDLPDQTVSRRYQRQQFHQPEDRRHELVDIWPRVDRLRRAVENGAPG